MIYIIAVQVLLGSLFRLSSFSDWRIIASVALGLSAFSYIIYPWAIEQNVIQIKNFLHSSFLINNLTLVYAIQGFFAMASSMYLLRSFYKKSESKVKVIRYVPSVMIFLSLAFFELDFFMRVQMEDFQIQAMVFSGIVFTIVSGGVFAFRYLIPEEDLRYELRFILGIISLILAILINASVHAKAITIPDNIDWSITIGSLILLSGLSFIGFIFSKYQLLQVVRKLFK